MENGGYRIDAQVIERPGTYVVMLKRHGADKIIASKVVEIDAADMRFKKTGPD